MRIGAVSGYGSMMELQSNYRINSVYGNPKNTDAIQKIGEENYSGNPFAVVSSKEDEADIAAIREKQSKPFDLDAAVKRAEQGIATSSYASDSFNMNDAIGRLMQGTRFNADTIPYVAMT